MHSSNRKNLKTPALSFSVDGRKHFENGAPKINDDIVDIVDIIVAFSNSSGVVQPRSHAGAFPWTRLGVVWSENMTLFS